MDTRFETLYLGVFNPVPWHVAIYTWDFREPCRALILHPVNQSGRRVAELRERELYLDGVARWLYWRRAELNEAAKRLFDYTIEVLDEERNELTLKLEFAQMAHDFELARFVYHRSQCDLTGKCYDSCED